MAHEDPSEYYYDVVWDEYEEWMADEERRAKADALSLTEWENPKVM